MAPRASYLAATAVPFLALLGWLSVNSSIAAFAALPQSTVIAAAEAAQPVTPAEARAAADANERAAARFDSGDYRLHAARALLALPLAERQRSLPRIERLVRESLAAAPMSPFGWTLLTFLRMDAQDVPGAVRAWDMSIMTGRYVPDLMQSRILIGTELMRAAPQIRDSVIDQIRVLAECDPASLAKVARAGGQEPLIRALLTDPAQSAAFERATKEVQAGAAQRIEAQTDARAKARASGRARP